MSVGDRLRGVRGVACGDLRVPHERDDKVKQRVCHHSPPLPHCAAPIRDTKMLAVDGTACDRCETHLPQDAIRGSAIRGIRGGTAIVCDMSGPSEVPPAARDAIRALANAATLPTKVLISGGIGTGKSTLLAAARETLRDTGLTVLTHPPRDDDPPDAAHVVDDAQLLSDTELARLADRAADPRATLVVAAEAHE